MSDIADFDFEDDVPASADQHSKFDGRVMVWKDTRSGVAATHSVYKMFAKSEVPRYLETNSLGKTLVYCLGAKVKGVLMPLWLIGSFFEFLPARLGRNEALDDAVSCICNIYCENPSISYSLHRGMRQSYAKALASLRGQLNDASSRMAPETLCASILLQMCEVSSP